MNQCHICLAPTKNLYCDKCYENNPKNMTCHIKFAKRGWLPVAKDFNDYTKMCERAEQRNS